MVDERSKALEVQLAAVTNERDGLKDRLMRALADMENMRKQNDRAVADAGRYSIAPFARDVLGLGDNITLAIAHVAPEAAEADPALKSFRDGITMLERQLIAMLERHGVVRIDPAGERFDPHRHQAVLEVENAEIAPGTVADVFQQGYLIHDRVLRPAMVSVSRGGPKPIKPAEPSPVNSAESKVTTPEPSPPPATDAPPAAADPPSDGGPAT